MEIKKSEFVISAPTVSKCPKDDKPEYAFIGRSNVGKSSLINMLCDKLLFLLYHRIISSSTMNGILLIFQAMALPNVQRLYSRNWNR